MIHKLTLQNFKGIESAEVGLERLTIFVGPNASGKTSVLQALHLLSQIANPDLSRNDATSVQASVAMLLKREQATGLVRTNGQVRGRPFTLQAQISEAAKPSEAIAIEGSWEGNAFVLHFPTHRPKPATFRNDAEAPPKEALRDWGASSLLRFESRKLAEKSHAESITPRIQSDGSGLASVLAQMALNRPDDFAELQTALKAIVPQVVRVRLSLAEIIRQEMETIRLDEQPIARAVSRKYSGHRILLDLMGASDVPSEGASEGTLLILGLLAVLFSTPRPKLVLLDDLDRGLHPKAQKDLVTQLRKLLERDPELQIIATSHSPYLVDHLDPKEVRLSTVLPDGTIRFAELMQHPDFERWKEVMRPGEFWSTVGENWVGSVQEKPHE
ncbi:AAA family ATPase [Pyxidicoccus caerfyrddinensis]|uniref:AAA family ATPase n=1 Tax=Pyxidicoccus caerfyrddinensis TaxID=2709663 RepID=UPI0013D9749C|nr:ATP-binding protein [Pyxidicoccus caerfyrddinensis]